MLSVVGKAGTMVDAMNLGAADYMNKPFEEESSRSRSEGARDREPEGRARGPGRRLREVEARSDGLPLGAATR